MGEGRSSGNEWNDRDSSGGRVNFFVDEKSRSIRFSLSLSLGKEYILVRDGKNFANITSGNVKVNCYLSYKFYLIIER